MKVNHLLIVKTILLFVLITQSSFAQKGAYYSGEFHQHTRYSDGTNSLGYVMQKNNQYGLDWWVNCDHGGRAQFNGAVSGDDLPGKPMIYWDSYQHKPILGTYSSLDGSHQSMYRWQILLQYSFPELLKSRTLYPDKLILQGFELNLPGHDHASVSIIDHQFDRAPNVSVLAEFEYKFDREDIDRTGGTTQGWTKSTSENNHAKTLESLSWLKNNYPKTSYLIVNHPERKGRAYTIADLRDMNNTAPEICFGFEEIPGSQKGEPRGWNFDYSIGGATYGGTGYYTAKIGGLWDALLTEGRTWWIFSNSDYHEDEYNFYPGEYSKNYTYMTDKMNPQALVDGLRSGNTWIVTGDLIDSLVFELSADNTSKKTLMGQTLQLTSDKAYLQIKVRNPQHVNANVYSFYNKPELDHIDVIEGIVTGIIPSSDPLYNTDSVSTTKVIVRFGPVATAADSNGIPTAVWKEQAMAGKKCIYH